MYVYLYLHLYTYVYIHICIYVHMSEDYSDYSDYSHTLLASLTRHFIPGGQPVQDTAAYRRSKGSFSCF